MNLGAILASVESTRRPKLVRSAAQALVRRETWATLPRMRRVYVNPAEALRRYVSGRGQYPYRCALRTPIGVFVVTAYSFDDMATINGIFCRLDYEAPPTLRVVVDIGSNIGISALYFLTRNSVSRCYLYEPNPNNVSRLRTNLASLQSRFELNEVAVADFSGPAEFGIEPTGVYGGIGVRGSSSIVVDTHEVNGVLAPIIEREGSIDLLKIDTEGLEPATVAAISPDLASRVQTIYYERNSMDASDAPQLPGFDSFFHGNICVLKNRAPRTDQPSSRSTV